MIGHIPAQEFLKGGKPTSIAEDVRKLVLAEREKNPIDSSQSRRDEDWSFLNSRVVGH